MWLPALKNELPAGLAGFLGVGESAQNWMGTSISSGPNC